MSDKLPTVLNVILCDAAYRDGPAGKWTLLGIFGAINAAAFPTIHPQMIIYLAVTGTAGKMPVRFQIVPADKKDQPIYRVDAELTVVDARLIAEVAVPLRNVTFPNAGQYLVQVLTGDALLTERTISVMRTQK